MSGVRPEISSETGSPALAACLGTLRKADSPAKEALGGAMLWGISRRWRPLMGPKGGALPSVRLRLRLGKPSRSTDRGHAKAARMWGGEIFQMWNGKLGRGAAAWGRGCPDAGAGNIEHGKGGPYIGRRPDAGETGPYKGPCRSPHRQIPDAGAGHHAAHSRHPRLVIDKALWKAA